MPIDLDRLKIFYTVAREEKIARASNFLNLSQSAISRQITHLEEGLDMKLFHRHPRGLSLTESGKILYRASEDILHRVIQVEEDLQKSKNAPHGSLFLSCPMLLGTYCVLPWLNEFHELYPDISLRLNLSEDNNPIEPGKSDAGIRLYPETNLDMVQSKIMLLTVGLYASKKYCEQYGKPTTPSELVDHHLIGYAGTASKPFYDVNAHLTLGSKDNTPRQTILESDHLLGVFKAVQNNMGIACLPNYLAYLDHELVPILTDQHLQPSDIYFVYPMELKHARRIKVLREFLFDKFKNAPFASL